ncbi:hypothetical protein, partial [Streptomyces sp. NPDC052535]|uniref:hypothetical protein n=1 Tax=Streptomyces sp. NPDC052535 TaxID=3155531 RepID=UPI003425DD65
MANPWDNDPIVEAAPAPQMQAQGNPWDADPIVADGGQGFDQAPLNIDIVGGTRESDARKAAAPDPTEGLSGLEKFFAGAGKSIMDSATGAAQLLSSEAAPYLFGLSGVATKAIDERFGVGERADREAAEARVRDKPMMDTVAGLAG